LADFHRALRTIKWGAGQSFREAALAAERGPIPDIAARLGYKRHLKRLSALCLQLQLQWGDRPFPLACRKAAEFLGVSKSEAWRLLNALLVDGVLELICKGTKISGKASEYRVKG
jgi:hypothetical protein